MPIVPPPVNITEIIKISKKVGGVLKKADEFIQSLRRQKITYRELITEIVNKKPSDSRIRQCAVLKSVNANDEIELSVLFLDGNSQPVFKSADETEPYGFNLTAKEIDDELQSIFNGKDLIIIS